MESQQFTKRRFVRTKLRAAVTLSHPDTGMLNLYTENISDGGAYILVDGQTLPGIGELVDIQVQGLPDGNAPVVSMRVTRIDRDGIALEFTETE